jgi:uncharacterized protein (TIGR00251 family)
LSFCNLSIRVIPNAPRNQIVGRLGSDIKVKIHAPPLDGRANDELCQFLAEQLDVPRRAVTLVRGETSRQKTVRVEGLTIEDVDSRLRL